MSIPQELKPLIGKHGGKIYALGVLLLVLGVLAVSDAWTATVAIQFLLGIILVGAGITWTLFAFYARSWRSGAREGLIGLTSLAGGLFILIHPVLSLTFFTLVMAVYFLATGVERLFLAFHIRPQRGWKWTLLNAATSLLLGGMVLIHWPTSSFWLIGVMVGVDMIFGGLSLMRLGSAARTSLPAS